MASQNNQNNDDSLWLIFMIIGIILIIGYVFGSEIGAAHIWWKSKQLEVFKYLPWAANDARELLVLFEERAKKGESFTFAEHRAIEAIVMKMGPLYVFLGVFAFMCKYLVDRNPLCKFKRTHSMQTLVNSEKALWAAIEPFSNRKMMEEDLENGRFAMAKRPIDFALKYNLLLDSNQLDEDKAENVFAAQLGNLWEKSDRLKPYMKGLLGTFIAHGLGEKEEAKKSLAQMSRSYAAGKIDCSLGIALLNKHENHKAVKSIISQHAYTYTVLASALEFARSQGILASAEFIWLKPVDRKLFYTLNCVGRRVCFVEIAGIFAHWLAEKVAEKSMERPYVVNAVIGLRSALDETEIPIRVKLSAPEEKKKGSDKK